MRNSCSINGNSCSCKNIKISELNTKLSQLAFVRFLITEASNSNEYLIILVLEEGTIHRL